MTFGFIQSIWSQDYKDLIITRKKDTIHCKISLVNDLNIFYQFNPKKKKIVNTYIARDDVHTFIINSEGIDVMNKGEKSIIPVAPIKRDSLIENNGIIYSTDLDSPPKLPGGINTLYSFLEGSVKVYYNRDVKIFDYHAPIVLFEVTIDSTGIISNAIVNQSSSFTGNFSPDSRFLEQEITEKILLSSKWIPAIINNKYSTTTVYLPLKFTLNSNRIKILPSGFIFSFKNRKKE